MGSPEKQQRKPDSAGESGVSLREQVEELLMEHSKGNWWPYWASFPAIGRRYLELEAANAEMRDALEAISKALSFEVCTRADHKPLRFPLCLRCQLAARIEEARAALAKAGRALAGPVEPKRNDDGR